MDPFTAKALSGPKMKTLLKVAAMIDVPHRGEHYVDFAEHVYARLTGDALPCSAADLPPEQFAAGMLDEYQRRGGDMPAE